MVNWYVPNKEVKEFMVEVGHLELKEAETLVKIFGYDMIDPMYGIVCALEFRELKLP
jgi:hypothetical protein